MIDGQSFDDLPLASRPFAETLRKKMGWLFGIHRRMAASPVVIAAYSGIGAAIAEHGRVDAPTRETIALAVGNQNGCDCCQAAHTLSAQRAAASNTGTVPQELRQAALSAAWTEEDLDDLFAHIDVNICTNHVDHYAGSELDLPPAPPVPRGRQ